MLCSRPRVIPTYAEDALVWSPTTTWHVGTVSPCAP